MMWRKRSGWRKEKHSETEKKDVKMLDITKKRMLEAIKKALSWNDRKENIL